MALNPIHLHLADRQSRPPARMLPALPGCIDKSRPCCCPCLDDGAIGTGSDAKVHRAAAGRVRYYERGDQPELVCVIRTVDNNRQSGGCVHQLRR